MITIFYTQFDQPLESHYLKLLSDKIPLAMRDKISRFKKWEDAHAGLLGKHLLLKAISSEKKDLTLSDLQYTSYGRPYFSGDFDFNISHSGNVVVCAVTTNGKVGVDIEERQNIVIADFKDIFSKAEWQHIINDPSPHHKFYDYWTKKEAVLKADGRGISDLLSQIDVSENEIILDTQRWYFSNIHIVDGYSCHLSHNMKQDGISVEFINFTAKLE